MDLLTAINLSNEEAQICWQKITTYLIEKGLTDKANTLGELPPIIWRKFGFRSAGKYRYWRNSKKDQVEMNINYLNIENPTDFVLNTLRHELAHCINHRIGSKKCHDKYWKFFARLLGDDGAIYHNYERPQNAPKKVMHSFQCTCGNYITLSDRMFNAAKSGIYLCNICHKNLKNLFDSNGNIIVSHNLISC